MRILSIIGTRPEALKMGPVVCALARRQGIKSLVCTTGQHHQILDQSLGLFGIEPDYRLACPRRGAEPFAMRALAGIGPVVRQTRPDWILAAGDTSSVLAASLAALHHGVRFAHVEAGLRTDCKWEPFPEEGFRRVASALADLHLAPTAGARRNLRRENVPAHSIVVTGNPIIDTLRRFEPTADSATLRRLWSRLDLGPEDAAAAPRLLVATFHRRENHGRPVREICQSLRQLAAAYRGSVKILCIYHPNPAVRRPTLRALRGVPHVVLSPHLSYPDLVAVLRRTTLVLTDSGGLQEEAPHLGVPVLVLRRRTERPEALAAGATELVGTDCAAIVSATRRLLDHRAAYRRMTRGYRGYGDGRAAARIVEALEQKHAAAR